MAQFVEWESIAASDFITIGGTIRSLRLQAGNTYTVRFVGNPIKFFRYYVHDRGAICDDPSTCPVRAKYNIDPVPRLAVNVLDRDEIDPKQRLKIAEFAPSVLKPVSKWARACKNNPGGKEGYDFSISVQRLGNSTSFIVTPLDITPFTDEERIYLHSNTYKLEIIYKAVPATEIERRLFPS